MVKTCEVPDCGRKMKGHGLCLPHLRRWHKTGERGGPIRRHSTGTALERIWNYIDLDGPVPACRPDLGPCWPWNGYTHKGYARFNVGGQIIREAHRVLYEAFFGLVPRGLVLDHLCRVTHCVRPTHLEVVTNVVNVERGNPNPWLVNKLKTECVHGHPFDEANTYVDPSGKRECRTCRRASAAKVEIRRQSTRRARRDRTMVAS